MADAAVERIFDEILGDCDRSEPEATAEAAETATDPLNIVEHLIERRRCQNNRRCKAIRILGNGKHRRCKTLVQHTVHSEDFPNYCGRNWHSDYMVGEGFLGRSRHQWQFCDSLRHWVSSLRRCAS